MERRINKAKEMVIVLLFCVSFIGVSAHAQSAGNEPQTAAVSSSAGPSRATSTAMQPEEGFVIGNSDVLAINVWKEPDLTRSETVRSDGKISLPLIGDVEAAGRTPAQLEKDIVARLRAFIDDPQVAVIVQEVKSENFNVLGQVNKPGSYSLTAGTTIVDAIATAGGFRDFAKKKSVYVLRQTPRAGELRIPFNYQTYIKGKNVVQNIKLKPHDTIVVP